MNTGIALAVAFDMVIKPTSLITALAIVGGGIVTGAVGALGAKAEGRLGDRAHDAGGLKR